MSLDFSKVTVIEFDGIDHRDAPDYCDAYITIAEYEEEDGTIRELTEDELDELNNDAEFVHDELYNYLY